MGVLRLGGLDVIVRREGYLHAFTNQILQDEELFGGEVDLHFSDGRKG